MKKSMVIFIIIFVALFMIAFISTIWIDYYSNVRYENKKLKNEYSLLEEKYYKLQREFSQLYKEKNKWVGEVVRLKEKRRK